MIIMTPSATAESLSPHDNRSTMFLRLLLLACIALLFLAGSAMAEAAPISRAAEPDSVRTIDSDGDGLADADERTIYNTNPDVADTDGDGLGDGEEVSRYGTNPLQRDSDFDGVGDREEVVQYGTDPRRVDTDGDARDDAREIYVDGTDPVRPDGPPAGVAATQRRFACSADSLELFYPGGRSKLNVTSTPDNVAKLDELIACMRACPTMGIIVEGNASSDGRAAVNDRLSRERAATVYEYIVGRGIDPKRVVRTYAMGSRAPKVSERRRTSAEVRRARSENRRVVIIVTDRCR